MAVEEVLAHIASLDVPLMVQLQHAVPIRQIIQKSEVNLFMILRLPSLF